MNFRFLLIVTLFFALISSAYSINSCVNEPAEFIVKCTVPEKYFRQDYTCFNKNCSDIMYNKGKYQELHINGEFRTNIFQNNIPIVKLKNDLSIIQEICQERIEDETLDKIQDKVDFYFNNIFNYYGEQKLIIAPYELVNIEDFNREIRSSKNFENCYDSSVERVGNWLIGEKKRKSYCDLRYDEENGCFFISKSYPKFIGFLFFNPNIPNSIYLFTLSIIFILIILKVMFVKKLNEKRELDEFFKITNKKIYLKIILLIPLAFIFGSIIDYLLIINRYEEIGLLTNFLLFLIVIYIIYFISCLIRYIHKRYF